MAQFDLKNALVYFQDGYSATGAVNNVAGYSIGATTMLVDGITGIVPVGAVFSVEGETDSYTVVSTVETAGNTTSLTFTPALLTAVADDDVVTVGPVTLRIKLGEGNLTFSEKRAMQYIKDRGVLDEVRLGDEEPVDVKLDMQWENLTASDASTPPPTPEDALKRRGPAAAWLSSDSDPCRPFAIDVVIIYTPVCEDVKLEKIVLPNFRYEMIDHDTKAGTISVTGKCNVTQAIVARIAQ